MDNLEDFLTGAQPEETPVSEPEAQAPEPETEASSQPRDPLGRFAPKGEQDPAPATEPVAEAAPPAAEKEPTIPHAVALEERRKRQEYEGRATQAEAEAAQLRAYIAQLQAAQQPQPVQQATSDFAVPVLFEDAYAQSILEASAPVLMSMFEQRFAPQLQQAQVKSSIDMQRALMGMKHEDFDTVEQAFWQMAQDNPALKAEALRQPNPPQWVYDYAKKAQQIQEIGSLDIEAIKAKAVADYLAQNQPAPVPPQIPNTLADAQSARTSAAPAVGPPLTLDQILGRK